ncbi:hypothetical protein GCK72_004559 [Caenorhabditis remanei]|uniref:Uncharacterized protein n=1 Tax=Caenorhabditis remanei TaxID=31234 RepID=A0A6A5H9Y4_CAERE|nr:hypothetical protein GCK72_004559 [Caenorhabditis remanei]KAF1764610.1 hypothetical protein GCK72_004559 [Caenorhabditis remanei]
MIRRVRVALKHSNPTYDEEEKSSLMPSLLGAPNNRYRLFFLILCFIFLYFWNRREQTYGDEIRRRDEKLEAVQREHDSVLEKLRVIWLHKKKIESDAKQQKADLDKFQSKFKLKESEIYGYRTKNKECLTELSSCQKESKGEKDEKPNQETAEKLKIEISGLKKKVGEMEEKMKEMENDSNSMAAILKDELKQCEAKIRQLTGRDESKEVDDEELLDDGSVTGGGGNPNKNRLDKTRLEVSRSTVIT